MKNSYAFSLLKENNCFNMENPLRVGGRVTGPQGIQKDSESPSKKYIHQKCF